MPGALQTASFGPFTRGVVDVANPSLALTGTLQRAVGVQYTGAMQLATRDGTRTVLTLKDDQGTPADVDAVCAVVQFSDGALAVAWSASQQDVYLYRLNSTLTDWYDTTGALQGTTAPEPIGVLWSSVTTAPDVWIAEGLGVAYLAHTEPVVGSTLTFATRTFTAPGTIADLTSDLDADSSAEPLYFAGVIAFQQHLWGWGFGAGTTGATGYRPELARFSQPIFDDTGGLFQAGDSLTIGNRVRSDRERIVGAGLAGEALYLGAPFMLTRITGYGRDSWYKSPVDQSHGFVGPKCMVTVGDTLYYWSSRGPMRITAQGAPEPLWDRVAETVAGVINAPQIVAGYDEATDTVVWAYDTGAGVRQRLAYDVRRDVFLGPDDDFGLALRAMGTVSPVYTSTASVSYGPAGAPTSASTTSIGASSAVCNWTAGDPTAQTQVEYRLQGAATWTVVTATLTAGRTSYTLTGLSASTPYEWRVAHSKGGTLSSYLGPSAATQFTTAADTGTTLTPPSDLALAEASPTSSNTHLIVSWTNSGEAGVSTEVDIAGPENADPGTYPHATTAGVGVASVNLLETYSGTYWVRVRHVLGGASSDYTPVQSIHLLGGLEPV